MPLDFAPPAASLFSGDDTLSLLLLRPESWGSPRPLSFPPTWVSSANPIGSSFRIHPESRPSPHLHHLLQTFATSYPVLLLPTCIPGSFPRGSQRDPADRHIGTGHRTEGSHPQPLPLSSCGPLPRSPSAPHCPQSAWRASVPPSGPHPNVTSSGDLPRPPPSLKLQTSSCHPGNPWPAQHPRGSSVRDTRPLGLSHSSWAPPVSPSQPGDHGGWVRPAWLDFIPGV